jgi:hypothetical protein
VAPDEGEDAKMNTAQLLRQWAEARLRRNGANGHGGLGTKLLFRAADELESGTYPPYFAIGDTVWLDGDTKAKVEYFCVGNPEHLVVQLDRGFFARKRQQGTSIFSGSAYDVYISSMVVHVSNLATSEGGERPYQEIN